MCRTYLGTNDLPQYFEQLACDDEMLTLDQLEAIASRLFTTYSMTAAYWHAVNPSDETTHNEFPPGDPCIQVGADTSENPRFSGDWVLANTVLLICDGLWFLEVCQAMTCGDIGRVWEVLKVSKIANVWCKIAYRQSPISRYGYLHSPVQATTIIRHTCWTCSARLR